LSILLEGAAVTGAILGGLATCWTYISSKRLDVFQTYIAKFNDIITPDDIEWWRLAMKNEPIPEEIVRKCEIKMLRYLNLVWEEHFLYSEGMISKKLWKIWMPNIIYVLNTDFCKKVFILHEDEFDANFNSWVRTVSQI